MANGDTKTNQYLDIAANGTRADLPSDTCCETRTQSLIRGVAERVMDVEDEVERLENNPDVVDIVATYADLQAYDTSTLTDKDVIRVLTDSNHNNNSTFYRWNATTNQFDYIGEVTSGPTVVQTIGTSTTDVMSQKAVTDELFNNGNRSMVQIGASASATGGSYYEAIAIGRNSEAARNATAIGALNAKATANNSIAIGSTCSANGNNSITIGYIANANSASSGICIGYNAQCKTVASDGIAIGDSAIAQHPFSVALGNGASTTRVGEINVGTSGTAGYQGSSYRVIGGVYDPQNAHDAATKGYVDNAVSSVITSLYMNYSSLYDPSEPGVTLTNQQLFLDEAMTQPITCKDFRDLLEDGTLLEIRAVGYVDSTVYINLSIASAYYPTDEGFYDGDTTPFITMVSSDSGMQKILLHKISAEDYNASTFSCRTIEVSTT